MKKIYLLGLLISLVALAGCAEMQMVKDGGGGTTEKVFFIEPADGATIKREFKVVMGVKSMQLMPAGELAKKAATTIC